MASAYDAIAGDYHPAQRGLTNRFAGEKETYSYVCNELNQGLWTPSAGKQITLYWISLNSSEGNTEEVKAVVELQPWEPYAWYLGVPSAFMHWEVIVGAVNSELKLKLSKAGQNVIVNFTISEDYPRNE